MYNMSNTMESNKMLIRATFHIFTTILTFCADDSRIATSEKDSGYRFIYNQDLKKPFCGLTHQHACLDCSNSSPSPLPRFFLITFIQNETTH